MKKFTVLSIFTCLMLVASLLLSSCAALFETVPQEPRYAPSFDFSRAETTQANSQNITIALINPIFHDSKKNSALYHEPYSTFISNMANDFEELLTAKGFTIRGPFGSRDEMVYGDKKNSALALEIEVDLKQDGRPTISSYSGYSTMYYKVRGSFYHHGNLNITITNPMNGEKFWKKSVALPRKEIVCNGTKKFNRRPSTSEMLIDNGVYNPLAKALEEYYTSALNMASKHMSPEEFKVIAKEIKGANQ